MALGRIHIVYRFNNFPCRCYESTLNLIHDFPSLVFITEPVLRLPITDSSLSVYEAVIQIIPDVLNYFRRIRLRLLRWSRGPYTWWCQHYPWPSEVYKAHTSFLFEELKGCNLRFGGYSIHSGFTLSSTVLSNHWGSRKYKESHHRCIPVICIPVIWLVHPSIFNNS